MGVYPDCDRQCEQRVAWKLELAEIEEPATVTPRPPGVSRWVDQRGSIGLNSFRYRVGATYRSQSVKRVPGLDSLYERKPCSGPSLDDGRGAREVHLLESTGVRLA
jgi:hypothetical protein